MKTICVCILRLVFLAAILAACLNFTYNASAATPEMPAPAAGAPLAAAEPNRSGGGPSQKIATGAEHTCLIWNNNTVLCWGDNTYGQLGNGTTTSSSLPVVVTGSFHSGSISGITAGAYHTCIAVNAEVYCWGRNNFGQLGNGTTTDSSTPVKVSFDFPYGINTVTAGGDHTCALYNNTLGCWGFLVPESYNTTPTLFSASSGFSAVSAGGEHTCAVDNSSDKKTFCWGRNNHHQLGNGTTNDNPNPFEVSGDEAKNILAVNAGGGHTCVLSNGSFSLYCWGMNGYGQASGNTAPADQTSPYISTVGGVTSFSSGDQHNCVIGGGTVRCWGYNAYGQLGNGTNTSTYNPVQVSGLSGTAQISAGGNHTCAIDNVAYPTVKCWGNNAKGQLGNGTTTSSSTPVEALTSFVFGDVQALGSQISGVTVTAVVSGVNYSAVTGDWGEFGNTYTINIPKNGIISSLTASKAGYTFYYTGTYDFSTPVEGGIVHQDFDGLPLYTISGTVTLAGASDHSGVALACGAYSGNSATGGAYAITGVPYGTACTVTPTLSGYEFDAPVNATISALSANLSGVDFIGSPGLHGIAPVKTIGGAAPAFQWTDGNLAPGWYQITLESNPKGQGLWSPLGDYWYAAGAADVCRVNTGINVCSAYPLKSLSAGYYRWRVRSSSEPLAWSDYLTFQVKKPVYAPVGAQGILPVDGSIEFRWGEMSQVFDLGKAGGGKQSIKAGQYRIILLSGRAKLLDNPAVWYPFSGSSRVVTCTGSICSITLNNTDFSASLAAGNYLWKVAPKYTYDYNAGKGVVTKTVVGAAVTGEAFSYNAPAPGNPLVMDKADMAAASVSGVSEPYFTWVAPAVLSATDKYEVTIEQKNPVSGAWKKVKGGEFSIGTPRVVKKVEIFKCTPGDKCVYYPGGAPTWKAGLYRWFVRYVTYPGKVYSPYAAGLTAGVDPASPDAGVFRVSEPFFVPQPVGPSGGNRLPHADGASPVFTWEADPSESVFSGETGSKYVLTVYTPKGKFSVDVAADACTNRLCSYTLTSLPATMTTPKTYPEGYLDYGVFGFSLKVGLLKAAGLNPAEAKSWAYGKESAKRTFSFGPRPVTDLVVTQTVAAKNPQINWTDADPDNTTGFQVLVERYDAANAAWVRVASTTLLKARAGVCNGTACTVDFAKAKPWWKTSGLTYRVWVTPFKAKPAVLGPAAIQEFVLPLK